MKTPEHMMYVQFYVEGLIRVYGLRAVIRHHQVIDLLASDRGRELLAVRYYALRREAA